MNKSKLPVKYHINVWKTLPGYPTKNDILYELSLHVSKMKNGEFSEQTFNGIWCDASGVANWKDTKVERFLNELLSDNKHVELVRTEEKTGKNWFKIKHLPWE